MGNFTNLPTDIVLDIITRVPTESILDCKLVCKPWRNLVSHHPSFSRLHLSHHLNRSTDSSGKLSFLVLAKNRKQIYYFEFTETTPIQLSTKRFNFTPPFASSRCKVIGSSNGLVCLYGYADRSACIYNPCICNPVTREFVMLPKIRINCDDDRQYINWSGGFGYLPLTNEYKVVEFYKLRREPRVTLVAVYTLGSGNGWRNVGKLDTRISRVHGRFGVFLNGALHWKDKQGEKVLSFDLTEEKFSENLSTPPSPPDCMWTDSIIGMLRPISRITEIISGIFPHKNTLVSLKELGEEDINVMESAETEET